MSGWQETRETIRTFGIWRVLYWRLFYARHMRFIHKRGRHRHTFLDPRPRHPDWPHGFLRCDWCGHMEYAKPKDTP